MNKICKLCGEEKLLRKSHILPEFYYKPIYDEKHKFFEFSTSKEHKTRFLQKGVREKLLCDDCEQQFSKYEKYASSMFNSDTKATKNNDEIIVNNMNYDLLKLHQLSVLWRIAISSLEIFKNINLPTIETDLKDMLLKQNPGNYNDYGCTLTLILNDNKLLSDLITTPEILFKNSNKYLRIICGGFVWIFSLQKNEQSFCNKYFLSETGTLIMKMRDAKSLKMLKKYADDLSQTGKLED